MIDQNNDLIEKYKMVAGPEVIDQLRQLAEPLKGIKLVNVSSTATGGGVAEILDKMVPIIKALGIDTRWEIIEGTSEFFECTKSFHNAIQGDKILLSNAQLALFEQVNKQNAERLRPILQEADIVIVHDPQPVPLLNYIPERKGKWLWRCHIDASKPYRPIWKYLSQFIKNYEAIIFSLAEFTQPLPQPMYIIPPSIDPLSEKNIELTKKEIHQVYELFGIDPERPMILQVSRYDRFKDPVGVIEAYKLAKKFNPKVQLVLLGSEASDDPEGRQILKNVKIAAMDNPDIHVLLLPPDAHRTVNAFQRAADIILQKSTKEGFGLTVTEGLWKSKPVIGGNVGGIKLQVINGKTGFVVNTIEGAAYRIRYLLQHPSEGMILGAQGKEYVKEKFLITRHVRDYLGLIYSLLFKEADRIELPKGYWR